MTTIVRVLVESIERLSDSERTEVIVEILLRSPHVVSHPIDQDEFLIAQVETFRELDAREAADEVTTARCSLVDRLGLRRTVPETPQRELGLPRRVRPQLPRRPVHPRSLWAAA